MLEGEPNFLNENSMRFMSKDQKTNSQQIENDQKSIEISPEENEQEAKASEPQKEILESVKNVQELLDLWLKESQEKTTDKEQKITLAHRILKMQQALGLARLKAEEVKIEDYNSDPDTLGFYEEGSKETGVT